MAISRIWGPGASASHSGARGFFASISTMVEESNMGFGPSLQRCFLEKGKTGDDAGFLAGSMSMSS